MKKRHNAPLMILVALFSMHIFSGCASTRTYSEAEKRNSATITYSLAQLQHDFKQLQQVIETQNPLLFADKQELSDTFTAQYALLRDNMTVLDFYRVLSPAVAQVRCGHTNLSISARYEQYMRGHAKYLPFRFFVSGNKLFVTENTADAYIPAGSEILMINGRTADEIITQLLNNLTADGVNNTKKYYLLNTWFNSVYYYYIENPEVFEISYRKAGSVQSQTISVPSVRNSTMDQTAMGVYFPVGTERQQYKARVEEHYAVLTIKTFILHEKEAYREFLQQFFAELSERKIPHLILDVRGNWGGDPYYAATLLSYLIHEPVQYFNEDLPFLFSLVYSKLKSPMNPARHNFTGTLYTLINGGCFSTTGHLCSLLKYHHIGTFIGTETGGTYICTDGSKDLTLKYTRLRLHYSTTPYRTEVDPDTFEMGRGIRPDYPIKTTIEDVLLQRDVEMDKALELIQQ